MDIAAKCKCAIVYILHKLGSFISISQVLHGKLGKRQCQLKRLSRLRIKIWKYSEISRPSLEKIFQSLDRDRIDFISFRSRG